MTKTDMKMVGKVLEAHGLKGDVYVFIFSGDISWFKKLTSFELRQSETSTSGETYHVERFRAHKKGVVLKAKELSDRTAAEKVEKNFFFVSADMFVSEEQDEGMLYLSEIEGFTVKTEDADVGVIVGFSSNGVQDLLIVEKEKKKFEIPFVQEFIVEINFDEKFVVMDLPPGLLEINS